MLLLRFGFTKQTIDREFRGYSPLNSGYISISQENKFSGVITARTDILFLVMDLLALMSGLIGFFRNTRTKHWSFSATDAPCNIHLDRRKHAMIYLQVNGSEGLHPEEDVKVAFQEALVQFYEDEYMIARRNSHVEGLRAVERDLDREFRECYQEFLTMQ